MKKLGLLLTVLAVGILLLVACQNNTAGSETGNADDSAATTEGFDAEWYETMGLTKQDREKIVSGKLCGNDPLD